MKKLSAIILVTLLVFSSAVIPASAAFNVPTYTIEYGQTITVKTNDSRYAYFALIEFIPAESGRYALTSSSDNDVCDPYCVLYDGKRIEILENCDDYYDLDFCLEYDFEAGKLYYFMVYDYDMQEAEFEVTLGCAHKYAPDGKCVICTEECPHTPLYDYLGKCACQSTFAGIDIKAGDSIDFQYDFENDFNNYLRFIPEADGTYYFYSESAGDTAMPDATIYDDEYNFITYADYVYEDEEETKYEFVLIYEFEAGKEYFIYLSDDYDNKEGFTVVCEKAVHTVLGDSEHELAYAEGYEPTCTEPGRTTGLYCPECNEYTFGYEEIPPYEHWDFNGDGICELCRGSVPLPDCPHICHSQHPILKTIWRIINFFNRMFSINLYCECGTVHI